MPVLIPYVTPAVVTAAYLGDSGIVLGATDDFGVRWKWTSTSPWGPKPAPREQVGDRAYADGQWDATRYYGPRSWDVTGSARAPDHDTLHAAYQRLADAVGIAPFEYHVTEPGLAFDSWFTLARQQGELLWNEVIPTFAQFSLHLFAADPLVYSSAEQLFESTLPASLVVTNDSARYVPLLLEIAGPADNLHITNSTTGENLTINDTVGAGVATGETLIVDTGRHLVTVDGVSHRSWVSGAWPTLAPGDNAIAVTADGTSGATVVTGHYRPARVA